MTSAMVSLVAALIAVESGGNDFAIGKANEVGCLQISPAAIADVNRIQGAVRFTRYDAVSRSRSIAMFLIYVGHYATADRIGRVPTMRDYAMTWHRGPVGWGKEDGDGYWQRVEALISQ